MIAIKRKDGGFSWMWLSPKADADVEVEKWKSIHGADYESHEVIDDESAPPDWNFIEAWEPSAGGVSINIDKARAFCHKVRRQFRDQALAPLDAEIAKQIPGHDPEVIESQREAIREKFVVLQEALDAAASIEDMSALMVSSQQ